MNYNDQLIKQVVEAYCDETGNTEWTKDAVITWALANNKWKPSRKSLVQLLREELDVAVRAKKRIVRGRKVRQYHCITRKLPDGYVQTVWAHIDVATEPFMEDSVARQRRGIAGVVYSLHSTIVYWKERNPESQIEALFDFRDDNADRDALLAAGQVVQEDESELDLEAEVEETV